MKEGKEQDYQPPALSHSFSLLIALFFYLFPLHFFFSFVQNWTPEQLKQFEDFLRETQGRIRIVPAVPGMTPTGRASESVVKKMKEQREAKKAQQARAQTTKANETKT